MLTGKKIRALFFGILILASVSIFFPGNTKALTVNDYKEPTNEITGASNSRFDGNILVSEIQEQYRSSPTENTRDFSTGEYYYVTDGKTYNIFKKGELNTGGFNGNNTNRDPSKDTLVGVVTSDGKYRELETPIIKNNFAAQQDAVNSATRLAGNNYDAWTATMSKDDSYVVGKEEEDRLRALQNEQLALQAKGDQATQAEQARLAALNTEINSLKDTNKNRAALEAQMNRSDRQTQVPTSQPEQIYCLQWDSPMLNLPGCAAIVTNWTMKVAAFFLWTAALLFDFTLGVTLNIRPLVEKLAIVNIGWGIFRDISNLFFIFLLLFAAIGTIVNSGKFNAKAMVPSILVAALLINFSLFFTKVIIDTSNIMALQFYANMGGGQLSVGENPLSTKVSTDGSKATGIAAIFLDSMNINNLYTISTTDIKSQQTGAITAATAGSQGAGLSAYNIALVGIGGTILFLVTAFVLFAATALFIVRTIILVALMTTSPIAFLAKAIPGGKLKALGDKWWDNLWKQVFFAPIYMAMMYIAVVAVRSLASAGVGVNGSWASMFNGDSSSINIIFTFVMIIGFMVFALVSAQSMGAVGASTAIGMGKKLQGWGLGALKASTIGVAGAAGGFAAKSVIGSAAYSAANSNLMRSIVSRVPGGGLIKSGFDGIAGAKFGTSKGYTQSVADRQKRRTEMADFAGGSAEFRNRRSFENVDAYMERRKKYLEDEKAASAARKNRTFGIVADKDGNVTSVSTTPSFTTSADIEGRRKAQQQHLSELKKKGKAAVDKVARKKGYLESFENIVGHDAKIDGKSLSEHFTGDSSKDYKKENLDPGQVTEFKKALNAGTITFGGRSKLATLQSEIATEEGKITPTSPGNVAKLTSLYRQKEAAEEKILTHLDAIDKLQQEPTT